MVIAVRSEMDSRPLIYPLLRVLKDYGKVGLVSDNKQVRRLLDSEEDGACRNIRVIYDESGATDTVFEEYGIVPEEYDFLILDNMGATEYDMLIIPLGEVVTDEFQYDVDELKKDANTRFVQFGKAPKKVTDKSKGKAPKPRPAKKARPRKGEPVEGEPVEEIEEEDDPAEKFRVEISIDEEFNVSERFYGCEFPAYQDIEDMEAKHIFTKVGPKMGEAIYDIFKDRLGIDKRMFMKSISTPDKEVRGHTNSTVADIDSNPKKNPRERRGKKAE